MSLLFDANGEYVDHGSDASLDDLTNPTVLTWIYPTVSDTNYRAIVSKLDTGDSLGWGIRMTDIWDSSAPESINVVRVTDAGNKFSETVQDVMVLSAWNFIGVVFQSPGTEDDIYRGDLTTLATKQTIGKSNVRAGASVLSDAAEAFRLAATSDNTTNQYRGRIAFVAVFDAQLTLAQIQAIQYRPINSMTHSSCVLLVFPGLHGASTVPDFSGNGNTGTVTNATIDDHVPLGPHFGFRRSNPYVVGAPPTTLAPTTAAPTTLPPTTVAPTTAAPTTLPPTTLPPTTLPPTTLAPTTLAPTTLAPTTTAPTTLAPTTLAPTTPAPTTLAPTTLSPTTLAPTTLPPTTLAPTTIEPTTLPPTTIAPTTVTLTTLAPTTIITTTLAPTTPSPFAARRRGIKDFGFSFRDRWRN